MAEEIKNKKKWYLRWWMIVFYVIGFIIVISTLGSSGNNNEQRSQQSASQAQPEQALKVSAVQLSEDYDANKVAADAKYKGHLLEIDGTIDSIGKDILDTPYVTLKGRSSSLFGVQCMFSKSDEPQLVTLVKGKPITLQGKISGELIGNVIVNGCQIVK